MHFHILLKIGVLFQYCTASINTTMLRNLECAHILSRFTQKDCHIRCIGHVVNFVLQTPLRTPRVAAWEDEARLVGEDEKVISIMAHSYLENESENHCKDFILPYSMGADLWVVFRMCVGNEYQKRGLPICICYYYFCILGPFFTTERIGQVVSAENN